MQLFPSVPDIRKPPYVTFSGATFNKTDETFDVNAAQYTSFYKAQRNLSMLPIRAHFDTARYKNKMPMPSNNTYVSVEGFLNHVDFDPITGNTSLFHISVDNIS